MIRIVSILCIISLVTGCRSSPKVPTHNEKENPDLAPKLTKPVVRKIWVPDKIEDDGLTMTGGHWKYFIDKGASWAN